MEKEFIIRSYGFGEIAQLYFPSITKKSASAQLRKWIKMSKTAMPLLLNLGYKPGNRLLTPMQVKTIIQEFGEP